jgi:hypothetical protein
VGPEFLVFAVLLPVWTSTTVLRWTSWLRRRTATPPWARGIALGLGALWVLVLMTGLCTALVATARTRVNDIADGMNISAMALIVLVADAAWLLACTWRWHWSSRPPTVARDGPYR